jgi:uncharacterized membrane protein YsdA (DUF1294 family)
MNVLVTLGVYLLLVNAIGFFLMGIDKWKARRGAFRVPENTLFIIALIGGSLGCIIGMYTFRHKTRHWYFVYGMPAILIIEAALLAWLYFFSPFHIKIM